MCVSGACTDAGIIGPGKPDTLSGLGIEHHQSSSLLLLFRLFCTALEVGYRISPKSPAMRKTTNARVTIPWVRWPLSPIR